MKATGYKEGSLTHVIYHKDGSWSGRLRWTDKQAKEFLMVQSMVGLYEDEQGYYSKTGELICTID